MLTGLDHHIWPFRLVYGLWIWIFRSDLSYYANDTDKVKSNALYTSPRNVLTPTPLHFSCASTQASFLAVCIHRAERPKWQIWCAWAGNMWSTTVSHILRVDSSCVHHIKWPGTHAETPRREKQLIPNVPGYRSDNCYVWRRIYIRVTIPCSYRANSKYYHSLKT